MRVISKKDLSSCGKLVCEYGESGVGKTVSTLQSSPKPILWVVTEPRDLLEPIEAAGIKDSDVDIAIYDKWNELIEFLLKAESIEKYKTVFLDSLTFLMNISLSEEIGDESFEARTKRERIDKPIASQTKLTMENRGVINNCVFRTLKALGQLSQSGKLVVVSCLLSENPKWNRELAAAPALSGREVPVSFAAFFDLIGLVQARVDENGQIIYPPLVTFESDGSFVAKFTGTGKKRRGPLDFMKILSINNNQGK
jgi:hypothetical protein